MATGTAGRGLALIRIGFGVYFLQSAIEKIGAGWLGSGEALTASVSKQLGQEIFLIPRRAQCGHRCHQRGIPTPPSAKIPTELNNR